MPNLTPSALFWAAWAALAGLLLCCLAQDALLLRRPACDTTYIYEGYEEVKTAAGGRYRLVKFADGDKSTLAARARLQRQRGTPLLDLPVLFVHGHLGSHQQMRSAAAETGRELARRAAADPAGWPIWLQWYAADFNAEASALDSSLLAEQSDFVLRCIEHLHRQHAAATAAMAGAGSQPAAQQRPAGWQQQHQQPFRVVLVAYSMGGLVARHVVRRLAADATFDMAQLVALLTLGSPHQFPRFMPHSPLASLLNRTSQGGNAAGAARAEEAAAAAVPRVNILAGAGDFSLPLTHAAAAPREEGGGGLTLLMRDMPGVWATCSHKAIVSCNQLVRQVVPVIVDATLMALEDGATGGLQERQAAVQALLKRRLATHATAALGLQAAADQRQEPKHAQHVQSPCTSTELMAAATAAGQPPAEAVTDSLLRRQVAPGATLRLSWEGAQAAAAGWQGLLLLVTAAPPGSGFSVTVQEAVAEGSGTCTEVAGSAVPLPPLLPSLQQRWVPRHWAEVMGGIDWQQNATRVLYVPFAPGGVSASERRSSTEVAMTGGAPSGSLLLAQAVTASPAEAPALELPLPGRQAALPAGHAAVLRVHLPQRWWPLGTAACEPSAGQAPSSLPCLQQLLLGGTPPWRLRIQQQSCDSGGGQNGDASLAPAVLAVQAGGAVGDSVRLAGSGGFGAGSGSAVQLWDGLGPLDRLWLISDPSCSLTLRLEWDLGGWLGRSLRHLLFILPPLCMAASQARLSPLPGSTARVAVAAALLAAWGSQHPAALNAATAGWAPRPWVLLSAAEALAAVVVAIGGASACAALTRGSVRRLRRMLPSKPGRRLGLAGWQAPVLLAAACLLPPAIPACLACLCLAVRLAGASGTQEGLGRTDAPPARLLAWLAFSSLLAPLPGSELLGRLLGGSWREAFTKTPNAWTDGRLAVGALAMHASLLQCKPQNQKNAAPRRWQRLAAGAGHETAACAAAAAALWGAPSFQMHAAVVSAALDCILA